MDPIQLAQRLLRCPSITPNDAGCLDIIKSLLCELGFKCWRLPYEDVENLYACYGSGHPHFCFAGHTDVVPVIDEKAWSYGPFDGIIHEGHLIGRGVVDMKGAIAAFITAVSQYITSLSDPLAGSISLILTSDEEGIALNGTRRVIQWLKERQEVIDFCLVGEPTNPLHVGEMVKIGRRGSLNGKITVQGVAGHIAYPHLAINPISILLDYLDIIRHYTFDQGHGYFDPTHLEISSIDVENHAHNVIPATAKALFNIRFNDLHTSDFLIHWLNKEAALISPHIHLEFRVTGESFYCSHEDFRLMVGKAIEKVTGKMPNFSTSGGTSDARFIKDLCPVLEFGLVSATAHHINENIHVDQIKKLSSIYENILIDFFNNDH